MATTTTMEQAAVSPPLLSSLLIARILSYNVTSVKDVASFRLLGNVMGKEIVQQLPFVVQHWIRCPERRLGNQDHGSFVERLRALDDIQQRRISAGVIFHCNKKLVLHLFKDEYGAKQLLPFSILVLDKPQSYDDLKSTVTSPMVESNLSSTKLKALKMICDEIEQATTAEQLEALLNQSKQLNFYRRPGDIQPPPSYRKKRDVFFFPAMVTFRLSLASELITNTLTSDGTSFYLLKHHMSLKQLISRTEEGYLVYGDFYPRRNDGCTFRNIGDQEGYSLAVDMQVRPEQSPQEERREDMEVEGESDQEKDDESHDNDDAREVRALIYLKTGSDYGRCDFTVDSIFTRKLYREHQGHTLAEGVIVVDDFLSQDCQLQLQRQVAALAKQRGFGGNHENNEAAASASDSSSDSIDSQNVVVRHVVDPLFFLYRKEIDSLCSDVNDVEPCQFPQLAHNKASSENESFFGRWHTRESFQMLPSYVTVASDGECMFDSYITHLSSPDDPIQAGLTKSLSFLLKLALPYMESVFSYAYAMSLLLEVGTAVAGADEAPLQPIQPQFASLRGQKLQVITHIMEYTPSVGIEQDTTPGGPGEPWHFEGMNHEDIVLTCLYILDNDDEPLQGGEIEFQRGVLPDEQRHLLKGVNLNWIPLGTVATRPGRLIVYPNCHLTRMREMSVDPSGSIPPSADVVERKRYVVKFHLVNPLRRIVSTREVPLPKHAETDVGLRDQDTVMKEREPEEDFNNTVKPPTYVNTYRYEDDGEWWHY